MQACMGATGAAAVTQPFCCCTCANNSANVYLAGHAGAGPKRPQLRPPHRHARPPAHAPSHTHLVVHVGGRRVLAHRDARLPAIPIRHPPQPYAHAHARACTSAPQAHAALLYGLLVWHRPQSVSQLSTRTRVCAWPVNVASALHSMAQHGVQPAQCGAVGV